MIIRNYEEFEANVISLKKIFEKLDGIFNIEYYKGLLSDVEKEVANIENSKVALEEIDYTEFAKKLNKITRDIDIEYLPYYEVYLYTTYLNELVNTMNETNYDQLKKTAIDLINGLSVLTYSKKIDQKKVLTEAYKSLYEVICNEEIINRDDVLQYIKSKNKVSINENISLLIKNDLELLPKINQVEIELKYRNEGLGYDYLSSDVIKEIALTKFEDKRKEFELRKQEVTSHLVSEIQEVNSKRSKLDNIKETRAIKSKEISKKGRKISIRIISAALAPILLTSGAVLLSAKRARFKKMHKTSYILETKEVINSSEYYSSDNKNEMYIYKYGEWKETEDGGYIRDVTRWYYSPRDGEEVNVEDIVSDLFGSKKVYTEEKKSLRQEDNIDTSKIYVTQYIVDNNDTKPDGITMFLLGLIIFLFSSSIPGVYFSSDSFRESLEIFKRTKAAFKDMVNWKEIKTRYAKIGDEEFRIQEEYKDVTKTYGDLLDSLDENDVALVKKYINKK